MLEIKITIFVIVNSYDWKLCLLSLKNQALNVESMEIVIMLRVRPTDDLIEFMTCFPRHKLIITKDDAEYCNVLNAEIANSSGKYLAFLNQYESIYYDAFSELISIGETYHSEIILGYEDGWNELTLSYEKNIVFHSEKLKKYYYNTSLIKEPTLIHTIGVYGNKIFEKKFIIKNDLFITIEDLFCNKRTYFARSFQLTNRITYIPIPINQLAKQSIKFRQFCTDIDNSNELRNEIISKEVAYQYEVIIMQGIFIQLQSNEFIEMVSEEQEELLEAVREKIKGYNFGYLQSIMPQYVTLLMLIRDKSYSEAAQYIELLHTLQRSQHNVKKYNREYKEMKKYNNVFILRLCRMIKKVGEFFRVFSSR